MISRRDLKIFAMNVKLPLKSSATDVFIDFMLFFVMMTVLTMLSFCVKHALMSAL